MAENQAVKSFESYMVAERKSRYTIKEYLFLVGHFLDYVKKDLPDIDAFDIERFKKFLATEKNYSKSSQYLAVKAIRLLYRSRSILPPPNLTPPKRSRKMPLYLSETEAGQLIEKAKGNYKNLAIISMLLYTGIRVGELCKLDIDDVDTESGIVRIMAGKGDKDRIVIISKQLSALIDSYIATRQLIDTESKALFVSSRKRRFDTSTVERIIRKAGIDAGISKRVTPHVLRHTFATSVLRNGGDIRFIQQILGHSSLATTQIYTHIDENVLKEMYQKFGPRF
ncbi:MAG: integrase [Thermoplasmatales archaeon B_DKE]|nr:MAG: integrase [Thermoplasmatales archaeon B_DKE]QRF75758.1 putative tyrosine recombinase XerC-like protein [Thermoplasmatales archaeon]